MSTDRVPENNDILIGSIMVAVVIWIYNAITIYITFFK